jgi:cysteine desulfurase/selenocysteine lyase
MNHPKAYEDEGRRMSDSTKRRSAEAGMEAIRKEFPVFHKPLPDGSPLVYLDNAATAQKPRQVIDKELEVYENYYANAYRGVYRFGARVDEELEATREKLRAFIQAEHVEEIIFTSGATMSINLAARAWGGRFLKAGDEVLLNPMEHHANLVPWQQIAREKGATCRFLPLTEDLRLDLGVLDEFLTKQTKLVAVSGMSNVTGTVNPVERLAERAREVGALVLVDGAQSVPHQSVNVTEQEIDFLAFSGHKMYGPSGIGVFYGRRELLDAMDPFLMGGHMIDRVNLGNSTWAPPPAKFEAGTSPIAQTIALGAAVDFINQIGFNAIRDHEHRLLEYAQQQLLKVPGLEIYGPAIDHKGAIASFTIQDAFPDDLAHLLDLCGVFVRHGHHCTMPLHDHLGVAATVRASFAIYNTLADVDALVEAIHFALDQLALN